LRSKLSIYIQFIKIANKRKSEIILNRQKKNKASKYVLFIWCLLHNSHIQALSKTLETLNIGQNMLTDETLSIVNESLKQNRVLLQLGMQSTELTCDGIITLAEIIETNQVLQVKFLLIAIAALLRSISSFSLTENRFTG